MALGRDDEVRPLLKEPEGLKVIRRIRRGEGVDGGYANRALDWKPSGVFQPEGRTTRASHEVITLAGCMSHMDKIAFGEGIGFGYNAPSIGRPHNGSPTRDKLPVPQHQHLPGEEQKGEVVLAR